MGECILSITLILQIIWTCLSTDNLLADDGKNHYINKTTKITETADCMRKREENTTLSVRLKADCKIMCQCYLWHFRPHVLTREGCSCNDLAPTYTTQLREWESELSVGRCYGIKRNSRICSFSDQFWISKPHIASHMHRKCERHPLCFPAPKLR